MKRMWKKENETDILARQIILFTMKTNYFIYNAITAVYWER